MPEREFGEWAAWIARDPSVGDRLDFWMPQLLAAVVNTNRRPAHTVKPESLKVDRWGLSPQTGGRFRGPDLVDMLVAWAGGGNRR